MKCILTNIPAVFATETKVFDDQQGFFFEGFNRCQLNVLRDLHYQIQQPRGKLNAGSAGCCL